MNLRTPIFFILGLAIFSLTGFTASAAKKDKPVAVQLETYSRFVERLSSGIYDSLYEFSEFIPPSAEDAKPIRERAIQILWSIFLQKNFRETTAALALVRHGIYTTELQKWIMTRLDKDLISRKQGRRLENDIKRVLEIIEASPGNTEMVDFLYGYRGRVDRQQAVVAIIETLQGLIEKHPEFAAFLGADKLRKMYEQSLELEKYFEKRGQTEKQSRFQFVDHQRRSNALAKFFLPFVNPQLALSESDGSSNEALERIYLRAVSGENDVEKTAALKELSRMAHLQPATLFSLSEMMVNSIRSDVDRGLVLEIFRAQGPGLFLTIFPTLGDGSVIDCVRALSQIAGDK